MFRCDAAVTSLTLLWVGPRFSWYKEVNQYDIHFECYVSFPDFTSLSTLNYELLISRNTGKDISASHIYIFCCGNVFQDHWLADLEARELKSLSYWNRTEGETRPYLCPVCPARYKRSGHLQRHLMIHRGKTFSCPICGKTYNRKDNLKVHVDTSHKAKSTENE